MNVVRSSFSLSRFRFCYRYVERSFVLRAFRSMRHVNVVRSSFSLSRFRFCYRYVERSFVLRASTVSDLCVIAEIPPQVFL